MTIVKKLKDVNIGDIVQLVGDGSEIVGYVTQLAGWKIKLSQENPFTSCYNLFYRNRTYDLNRFTDYKILGKYTDIATENRTQ